MLSPVTFAVDGVQYVSVMAGWGGAFAIGGGTAARGAARGPGKLITYALPSVNLAAMPARSGGQSAGLDEATQRQFEEAQRSGPYPLANRLGVDEIIDPREIRNAGLNALVLAEGRDRAD